MERLRAQFFYEPISKKALDIGKLLLKNELVEDNKKAEILVNQITQDMISEADKIILPVFVNEFHKQKSALTGDSSCDRYDSFFLKDKATWHPRVKNIYQDCSFEFGLAKIVIDETFQNLTEALIRLQNDKAGLPVRADRLKEIRLGLSDRHNHGKQVVIFCFEDGKIVYKPRSVQTDILLAGLNDAFFDKALSLPVLYKAEKDYGWFEYIEGYKLNERHYNDYYFRYGRSLAVLQLMNFTDGHHENFISRKKNNFLVDSETILTNTSYFLGKTDTDLLSFTGVLQEFDNIEDEDSYTSALHAYTGSNYYPLLPSAINDGTDDIALNYSWRVTRGVAKNYPSKTKIDLKKYAPDFESGYRDGLKCVTDKSGEILDFVQEQVAAKDIPCRQIIRHTLFYNHLLCLISNPSFNSSDKAGFLQERLPHFSAEIASYETRSLLKWDVPCFYHTINTCDLYAGDGTVYKNFFSRSALDCFKERLSNFKCQPYVEKNLRQIADLVRYKEF